MAETLNALCRIKNIAKYIKFTLMKNIAKINIEDNIQNA